MLFTFDCLFPLHLVFSVVSNYLSNGDYLLFIFDFKLIIIFAGEVQTVKRFIGLQTLSCTSFVFVYRLKEAFAEGISVREMLDNLEYAR